jgi:hypothetical protein
MLAGWMGGYMDEKDRMELGDWLLSLSLFHGLSTNKEMMRLLLEFCHWGHQVEPRRG